jgi:hypothetical protein
MDPGQGARQDGLDNFGGGRIQEGVSLMKHVSIRMLVATLCSLLFVFSVLASEQFGGYHLLKAVPLGGVAKGGKFHYQKRIVGSITSVPAARAFKSSHNFVCRQWFGGVLRFG